MIYPSIHLIIFLSIFLYMLISIYLFILLSFYLSIFPFFLSIHLFILLSFYLSIYLYMFISIHLTICLKIYSMLRPKSSITCLVLYTLNVVHTSTFRIYLSIYLTIDLKVLGFFTVFKSPAFSVLIFQILILGFLDCAKDELMHESGGD